MTKPGHSATLRKEESVMKLEAPQRFSNCGHRPQQFESPFSLVREALFIRLLVS